MKVVLTVAVRNPEWYWSKQELEEVGEYRKEWEALNEDKIEKHLPSWAYEIAFDVKDIKENREAEYEISFVAKENKAEKMTYCLKDVTVVTFVGDNHTSDVVISNSLIYQYVGVRKMGYKYYIYFYLKGDVSYEKLHQLIWISEQENTLLEETLGIKAVTK
jgi:hypothetical protein